MREHVELCLESVRTIFGQQVRFCLIRCFPSPTEQGVISYYLQLLLTNVCVTDTNTVPLLNAVYALTGWIAAAAGARFHDIVGRRKMMLGSIFGMIICLSITTGTGAG